MASNGTARGGLLSAGGILSIMAGILEINAGVVIFLTCYITPYPMCGIMPYPLWLFPFVLCIQTPNVEAPTYLWPMFTGGLLLALGILAIAGGILAIRRKRVGLSLAGAICALPKGILGILAVIFVALGKREFKGEGPSGV
jgi:hypothetical protein